MLENVSRAGEGLGSVRVQVFEEQTVGDPLHQHAHWEVVFITGGGGRWQIGGEVQSFQPGVLALTPPGALHRWESGEMDRGRVRVSGIVVRFSRESVPEALLELPEMSAVTALLEASRSGLRFAVPDRDRLVTRLRSIDRSSGALRYARFIVALELIAGYERRQVIKGEDLRTQSAARSAARMEAVKRFLEREFRGPISRSEAAEVAGMDEAAFSRFFHAESGTTYVDYVANLRVRHAATVLGSRRDLTVAEVARRSGFRSETAFHRQFKKRLGTTPNAYRRAANVESQAP